MTYIELTLEQATAISRVPLNDFLAVDALAGKLLNGKYAMPKEAIVAELTEYKVLEKLKVKLDIANMSSREIRDDEWDKGDPPR